MALLCSSVPLVSAAEQPALPQATTVQPPTQQPASDASDKQAVILSELTEKREENVKQFLMSDGTFLAATYATPVHYEENGAWKDVDNRLVDAVDENNQSVLQNKAGSFQTRFAKKAKSKKLVSLTQKGHKIEWALQKAKKVSAEVVPAGAPQADENRAALKNLYGTVRYPDILTATDLQYTVTPTGIKEDIILKNSRAPESFSFDYALKKVGYRVNADGAIEFFREDDPQTLVFTMDAPYMYDAGGAYSEEIEITVTETQKGFTLRLIPDAAWLEDADRLWPVTIDPTIQYPESSLGVTDTFVHSGDPSDHSDYAYLLVGKGTGGESEGYIRFDALLPMVYNMRVVSARLHLITVEIAGLMAYTYTNPTPQITVQQVGYSWSDTMSWNQRPPESMDGIETDCVPITGNDDLFSWDITSIVNNWYNGDPNYGLVLRAHESMRQAGRGASFVAPEYMSNAYVSGQEVSPYFEFYYSVANGLESYWPYHTATANNAGTASVNDFNGNLVYGTPQLAAVPGNRLPFGVSLVYNSAYSHITAATTGQDELYGRGFRLSMEQRLTSYGDTEVPYSLLDGDGTLHYFYKDTEKNEIRDQSGLGLKVTDHPNHTADARWDVTDKDGNVCVFDSEGYIRSISDPNGNTITYTYTTYSGVKKRISTLTGAAGHQIQLTYSSTNGKLSKITDPAGRDTTFTYNTDGALTKISTPDGDIELAYYTAAAEANQALLWKIYEKGASNSNRYYIELEYNTLTTASVYSTPRVTDMYEKTENGVLGNSLQFDYQCYQTTVTDKNLRRQILQFNAGGNPTYQIDGMGNVQAQVYSNEMGFGNNRLVSSSTQSSVNNLLQNHRLDKNLSGYYTSVDGNQVFSHTWDGTKGHTAKGSMKVSRTSIGTSTSPYAYVRQMCTAPQAGYYTFSAYVNTGGVELAGNGAVLRLERWSAQNENLGGPQTSVNHTAADEWKRVSVTNYYEAGDTVKCLVGTNGPDCLGTMWFDDLQLETGVTANPYNLVENSSFLNGTNSWDLYGTTGTTDITTDGPYGFTKAGTLTNIPGAEHTHMGQWIEVDGKKGDVLSLCGWAKADALPKTMTPLQVCAVSVELYDENGFIDAYLADFNPYVRDWQFTSRKIIAPRDYIRICVFYLYTRNIHTMTFTGICVQKEQYGQTYTYDDDGNVVSSVDKAESQSTFDYTSNQLSKIFNPSGSNYAYSYNEDTKQVDYALSSDGVMEEFQYDSAGNPTIATTWAMQPAEEIVSGRTYWIINAKTRNALDCAGNAMRSEVHGWNFIKNHAYQEWTAEASSDGLMRFNVHPGGDDTVYRLDVAAEANTDNATIFLYTPLESNAQKYKLQKHADGSFSLLTKCSNFDKCVDGQPGDTSDNANGVKVKQFTYSEEDLGQRWFFYEVDDSVRPFIRTAATYSMDKNYMIASVDARGNSTTYYYDEDKGLLTSVTDPLANTTEYTYDPDSDQLQQVSADGMEINYSYIKDRLTGIQVDGGASYTLAYDDLGRSSSTKVGNTTLSSMIYNNRGLLLRQNYGNGDYVNFSYDLVDRLTEKRYNDGGKITYYYGADGQLAMVSDSILHLGTRYVYDLAGRLVELRVYTGETPQATRLVQSVAYTYADGTNYITQVKVTSELGTQTVDYTYGSTENGTMPDTVYTVRQGGVNHLQYSYDDLGRLSSRTIAPIGKTQSFTYLAGIHGANSTTTMVESVTVDGVTMSYTYDDVGNISSIKKNGAVVESYEYDGLNQLTKVTCANGDVYTYTYQNGNITGVRKNGTSVKTYSYTDAGWKDKLTAFNGNTITYDAIGNPLTYHDGKVFTWQNGRQLAGITDGGSTYSYAYNADGLRTAKTVNGVTTNYTVIDGTLIGEKTGSNSIAYLYDESGTRYGFIYNGIYYYYDLNLQGDVVGIYDSTGTKVVEYTYNAWGELLSMTGTQAATVGNANPIRYRGYYYDQETGYYYLQSRYYDPETQRFLNADGYISTGQGILGYNMFAYCGNNPIMYSDYSGESFIGALGGALSIAVTVTLCVIGIIALSTIIAPPARGNIIDPIGEFFGTIGSMIGSLFRPKDKTDSKATEKDLPITPPSQGKTYYHVTSMSNASVILATGRIQAGEGGHVYAWKTIPSNAAINNSGSRYRGKGSVIIAFETIAAFEPDPTINRKTFAYGPVRSCLPGSIFVSNPRIVKIN